MNKSLFIKLAFIGALLASSAAFSQTIPSPTYTGIEAVDEAIYGVWAYGFTYLSLASLVIGFSAAVYGAKKVLRLLGR